MPILRVQKSEAKLMRPLANISPPEFRRGLAASLTFPWLKAQEAISSEELVSAVQSQAPADGREIVEWMQLAAAEGALLDAICEDYNRLGSLLLSMSGDPWLPGVGLSGIRVESLSGDGFMNAGGAVIVTPKGNFNLPAGGKATGIFSDLLAWAANTWKGSYQWLLSLLGWIELASTPIDTRVRFPNLSGRVGPQFFIIKSQFPPPAMMMSIGFTSNRQQKVSFQMRSPGNYTNVLASDTLEIPAGQSSLDYIVLGFPSVDPFVAHFQPEDGTDTILDSISVTPP